jgi:release factor glutamine methyltransferase
MTGRRAVSDAVYRLTRAGVASPRTDAELLAAHVLGVERSRLWLVREFTDDQLVAYRKLIDRRAARVPLQYLLGTAPMGPIEVEVGPGVFIPRPETELLYEWAVAQVRTLRAPVVVDLCTGTAALALAIAHTRPDAEVHAVELDPRALRWAQRNAERRAAAGDTPVTLHSGDVTAPGVLAEQSGEVDLVVANPPYIPADAGLAPEVARHDPHLALFSGPDGLDVIRGMIPTVARLLKPGAAVGIEHDDSHGDAVASLLSAHGFTEVVAHDDLAGKPRYVTARLAGPW